MKIINGDSLEVLKRATPNSIDAVVCDPPYFLINNNGSGFMNKDWDGIMGLWKYQWNDKAFVDFVISLLKSCRVENDMVEVNTVQENANTQAGGKTTENIANYAKGNLSTQTKSKGSAQVIVLTKQGLLDLLKGKLSVLTKLNQFLIGEKENAVYVIPIISLQSERKAIVQKSVTTLHKAIGLQETKITFTKTELQKKRDAIEAIIGESSENLFIKGMGGNVDIVQSIVVNEKSNATTSHPIDSQQTMANLTLLLCAYFATRKSSEIQKDLIKTFFRVIFLEVNRVLKPGGHVLAFAGSRTYQWLATGIEDAGFEIRDQIMWVYGSGFPKSHNLGKSVDKLQGNEREVTGQSRNGSNSLMGGLSNTVTSTTQDITKGSSPYEGWGTALKPAHEPIVVARKPLSEKTIAKNVLEWGTGGINIDGCRVGTETISYVSGGTKSLRELGRDNNISNSNNQERLSNTSTGRLPANFIHDGSDEATAGLGDKARYFYTAKASKKDRNEGLEDFEEKSYAKNALHTPKEGSIAKYGLEEAKKKLAENSTNKNTHPTIKPTSLMQYLVRLVTPVGGTVLDPFAGSFSTGKACVLEGFEFIGIELDPEYCKIGEARMKHAQDEVDKRPEPMV
jgi:DNA modification methylase